MYREIVKALIWLIPVWLLAGPLTAQQEPETTFEERIEVTEVLLDVVVTDAAGNIIIGLQPEDFQIRDGDRDIAATSATFYSNRRFVQSGVPGRRLGIDPQEIPTERYFILFFHDQRAEDPDLASPMLDAIRWTKDWVQFEALENDWVAVVAYDFVLKVHQDFTNNVEELHRALDAVAKNKNPGLTWPSRSAQDSDRPSLKSNLPQGKELKKSTIRTYGALTTVAEATGPIVGRKNLMLFSMGFGKFNDVGTYLPDARYYPPMKEALNDNNVAVYSISWLRNRADENPGQEILNNSLSLLADDTGGQYYFNFVNFKVPLQKIADDNNGYYLLSYKAEYPSGQEGYREVEVSTTNPDFTVRARKGYKFGD